MSFGNIYMENGDVLANRCSWISTLGVETLCLSVDKFGICACPDLLYTDQNNLQVFDYNWFIWNEHYHYFHKPSELSENDGRVKPNII